MASDEQIEALVSEKESTEQERELTKEEQKAVNNYRIIYKYIEYVWDISFTIPNRNISFRPHSIVQFTQDCDYTDSFIPSYTLTVKIEDKYLDHFRFFDKELIARIKVLAFWGETAERKNNREVVFEDTFAIYVDKSAIPSFSKLDRTKSSDKVDDNVVNENEYTSETVTKDAPIKLKMNLLLRSDLKMKTYIHNYVFGTEEAPVDPLTAAMACVSLNPYVKRVIVDKPDNTSKYSDLIVEPGELKTVLYTIQRKYGIYAKSMQLFFNMGTLYILNKLNPEHAKTRGRTNLIALLMTERQDKPNLDYSIITDTFGGVAYKRSSAVMKQDFESINSLLHGDKFVFSNFGTVINSVFADKGDTTFISPLNEIDNPTQARADIGVKKVIDYDMLNNPYNMSSYMFEQNEGVPIGLTLDNVDIRDFAPNTRINVKFDNVQSNKLYSGSYNIKSANFVFNNIGTPNAKFRTYGHVNLLLFNKRDGFNDSYTVIKPD